ncbi:MAG: hypothetical protein M3540_11595 [Actinomycetota bacterium]|nr:hypothetical protein [Actinomycetota bacterium]
MAGFGVTGAPSASTLPPPVGGTGRPVTLGPADAAKIARFNSLLRGRQISPDVVELAKGEHAFYRFKADAGRYCYSVSTPGSASKFGPLMCGEGFPSTQVPLLDMSVVEASSMQSPHFINVRGFASDAVARVGLATSDGKIVASVPVINNTYELTDLPEQPVSTVIPLGRDGARLTKIP